MDLGIKDKVVLITGGGRGLGRIDALRFAKEGCRVAVCDIDLEGTKKVAEEITSSGGAAIPLKCDISKPDQIKETLEKISTTWKPVDILVNNAAVLDNMAPIDKMKDNLWLRDMDINLTGTYYVTKACFTEMKAQKWGRIVTMSSVAGALGGFGQASYSATKGGVISLMKTVALEGGRFNITANSIVGGIIRTEAYGTLDSKVTERLERRTALGRPATPEEIADAIVFLCSTNAGYITGTELIVAGGINLFTF
jgi:3-oxoacyl-[acyl-carrier protein] reductase